MTRTPFYHMRLVTLYGFGTALALLHMHLLWPNGPVTNHTLQDFAFLVMSLCLVTSIALHFFDHMFSHIYEICEGVQEGVIAIVTPTAIVVLLPSLYQQLWHGASMTENQLWIALRMLSFMALYVAIVLFTIALLGRVAGKLLFR